MEGIVKNIKDQLSQLESIKPENPFVGKLIKKVNYKNLPDDLEKSEGIIIMYDIDTLFKEYLSKWVKAQAERAKEYYLAEDKSKVLFDPSAEPNSKEEYIKMMEEKGYLIESLKNPLMEEYMKLSKDDLNKRLSEECSKGNLEKVKLLCSVGADIKYKNISNCTPLHEACYNGHIDTVKYLVGAGADIECKTKYRSSTPLHQACARDHVDIVKFLIHSGANTESTNSSGHTPLDYLAPIPRGEIEEYIRSRNN